MKFVVLTILSLLISVASAFHIVSPSTITACEPLTVEYDTETGHPPFSLSFHTGSADGPVAAAFTNVTGVSFTWGMMTIPVGTEVVIVLGDSNGLGSDTPVITVSPGPYDVCLDNPTPIPALPLVTSTSPPTSTFGGSSIPSSLSSTTTTTTAVSSPTPSSLTESTNTPRPASTSGLGTSAGVVNSVGSLSIFVTAAIVGGLLA